MLDTSLGELIYYTHYIAHSDFGARMHWHVCFLFILTHVGYYPSAGLSGIKTGFKNLSVRGMVRRMYS